MKRTQDEWARDFQDFMSVESVAPPKIISDKILAQVHRDLNPPLLNVLVKVGVIQTITGAAVVSLCPMLGIGSSEHTALSHFFMQLGEIGCHVACGSFFVGLSFLVTALVLRAEEIKALRRHRLFSVGLVSLVSLAAFLCLGAPFVAMYFAAWFLGGLVVGAITLEIAWGARAYFRKRLIFGL